MRKIIAILFCTLFMACAKYPGVPEKYHDLLEQALVKAGANQIELAKALRTADTRMKEGVAFLVSYMPERDLKSMKADNLLANVRLAYEARDRFTWAKNIPDSIFLNDVLPYASLNEERDNWRADFYQRFAPHVEKCTTLAEAIKAVNKNIRDEIKVDYNTARKKPDQNPSESIRQGMASCSGLSILLTDALRAVGIPSRIAGTANWHDNRGNHNWCEVWLDGKWHFTEYYPNELDRSWFLADAGKADPNDRMHAIWASSFKPTGESFPLVWDFDIDYVPAFNVTQRYLDLYTQVSRNQITGGDFVKITVVIFKGDRCTENSNDREATNVDIFCGKDQIGGGRTADSTKDMNDMLEFIVKKNKEYTLNYFDKNGKWVGRNVKVKDTPVEVKLHL